MKKKLTAVALAFLAFSCNNLLEPNPADSGQTVTEVFYTDYNGALQGVNGVYNSMQGVYRDFWIVDVMSDDTQSGPGGDQAFADHEEQTIMPNNPSVSAIWNSAYNGIMRANVFLERAPGISLIGNQAILRDQFVGEVHFLRALHYFNLVRLFGAVPLITTEVTNTNSLTIPRTPVAEIYALIERDLQAAISSLPARHPNPALIQPIVNVNGGREAGRATSGAARTMLANLYLIQGKNAEAETLLKEVVNSGVYSLVNSYANNFQGGTKNNAESVFEVQYINQAGMSNSFSFQFGPAEEGQSLNRNRPTDNTLPDASLLNNTLVQAFEENDNRKNASVKYSAQDPRTINAKYYVPGAANLGSVNWGVYRYADVLLLLAEALQNQNKDAEARGYADMVRARAGLESLEELTGTDLRDAIRAERRVESNQEGKRWFDLIRWGILEPVMLAHGRPVKARTAGLLPIPQGEMDKNRLFTQNAGY